MIALTCFDPSAASWADSLVREAGDFACRLLDLAQRCDADNATLATLTRDPTKRRRSCALILDAMENRA